MHHYYALTVRKLGREAQKDDYNMYLQHLKKYHPLIEIHKIVYEKDDIMYGWHLHGLISIDSSFWRSNMKVKGYNFHVNKLTDTESRAKWDSYLNKQQKYKNNMEEFFSTVNISTIEWSKEDTRKLEQEDTEEAK